MSRRADFSETRRRLIECAEFAHLQASGHDLIDGAVLTAVSNTPFEMSFKCVRCAQAFWFENLAWRTGGAAEWRFSPATREEAGGACLAAGPQEAKMRGRLPAHP